MNQSTFLCLFLVFFFLFFISVGFSCIDPLSYGLIFSTYTGYVDTSQSYSSGRHFLTPLRSFILFPASSVLVEMSSSNSSSPHALESSIRYPAVDARTGRDANDPDSGGQPVRISLSFVYRLNPNCIGFLYRLYGTQWESRYVQYARQAISDVAQKYEPTAFWQNRQEVADDMGAAVAEMIQTSDHGDGSSQSSDTCRPGEPAALVDSFQLLGVEFSPKYEESIIGIQLASQSRITNEYQQRVVRVLKEIDVLSSQCGATIVVVQANAAATSRVLLAETNARMFNWTQQVKAAAYQEMMDEVGWNKQELVQYLKVKTIRGHRNDRLVLGIGMGGEEEVNQLAIGSKKKQTISVPVTSKP